MKVKLFTKDCLPCIYDKDWNLMTAWLTRNDIAIKQYRTVYNPIWHQIATRRYGGEGYSAFFVIKKKIVDVSAIMKSLKEEGDYDLQRLLRAKKSTGKNRKMASATQGKKSAGRRKGQKCQK